MLSLRTEEGTSSEHVLAHAKRKLTVFVSAVTRLSAKQTRDQAMDAPASVPVASPRDVPLNSLIIIKHEAVLAVSFCNFQPWADVRDHASLSRLLVGQPTCTQPNLASNGA